MPLKKICLITNPGAGRRDARGLSAAVELLRRHVTTEMLETTHPGHATELAAACGQDPDTLVAICGGDGTIFEALNGLPPQGVLGLLPGGTANVIVREMGIPLDIREAAKVLLTGTQRRIDTGLFNHYRFLMVSGAGFDAHVAGKVHPWLKRRLGQYAYHLETACRFWTYDPPHISITVDGQGPYEGPYAIIANMRRYGGHLFFAHDARYDDGLLNLVLFRDLRLHSVLQGAGQAFRRLGVPDDIAYRLTGREFIVQFDQETPFQLDGEVFAPVRQAIVRIQPQSVQMIVP